MKKIIIIMVVLVVGGGGYFVYQKNKSEAQLRDLGASYTVTRQNIAQQLALSGKIDAEEKVDLSFQSAGRLARVNYKVGDFVKKGSVVAALDTRDLQKRLELSLNNYMTTRWDFENAKLDDKPAQFADGDLGDRMKRILGKAQFGLNNSVLNVELAALAKEYSVLVSPIDGVLVAASAPYAGVNTTPSGVYSIVNAETVNFVALADQTEVPSLVVGQVAEIAIDAYSSQTVDGAIKSISFTPKTGENGTVYEVKIAFVASNDTLKYRIGMTGDSRFKTAEKFNVNVIPITAIQSEKGKKVVSYLQNGAVQKKEVKLGLQNDTMVEVVSGLQTGDQILESAK